MVTSVRHLKCAVLAAFITQFRTKLSRVLSSHSRGKMLSGRCHTVWRSLLDIYPHCNRKFIQHESEIINYYHVVLKSVKKQLMTQEACDMWQKLSSYSRQKR